MGGFLFGGGPVAAAAGMTTLQLADADASDDGVYSPTWSQVGDAITVELDQVDATNPSDCTTYAWNLGTFEASQVVVGQVLISAFPNLNDDVLVFLSIGTESNFGVGGVKGAHAGVHVARNGQANVQNGRRTQNKNDLVFSWGGATTNVDGILFTANQLLGNIGRYTATLRRGAAAWELGNGKVGDSGITTTDDLFLVLAAGRINSAASASAAITLSADYQVVTLVT